MVRLWPAGTWEENAAISASHIANVDVHHGSEKERLTGKSC